MGFRAGPFVLCKDRCCRQRRRNTSFVPRPCATPPPPPHMCRQNDQRNVGIILCHICWGRPPPFPPTHGICELGIRCSWPPARQVGHPLPEPPLPGTAIKEGGGVGQMGFRAIPPPPPQSNVLTALPLPKGGALARRASCRANPLPMTSYLRLISVPTHPRRPPSPVPSPHRVVMSANDVTLPFGVLQDQYYSLAAPRQPQPPAMRSAAWACSRSLATLLLGVFIGWLMFAGPWAGQASTDD